MDNLRLALRTLRRSPGFTIAGVLVLAIGVGGSTAVFSVLRSVILRQLAVPAPEQLVRLYELPAGIDAHWPFPGPDYFDVANESSAFQSVAGIRAERQTLTGRGTPITVRVARVTASFFPTLRVWPVLGGIPDASQDVAGGERTAVVTDGFWRRSLGGDPAAIGKTLVLDGRTYTIGGVMAPDFRFPLLREAEVLLSASFVSFEREFRGSAWLTVIGRVKQGTSLRAAQADIETVAPRIFARSAEHTGWHMEVQPLLEDLVGPVKPALTALLGAVLLALLIACANLASLMLARGMSRQRELAIRAAVGGGRADLVRHLLTEAMLIAVLGGALALVLAPWALSALISLAPRDLPRLEEVRLDGVVLGFALLAAVLAGLCAGLVPALRLSQPDLMEVLKNGSGGSAGHSRARTGLVVAEIALAFVLAASAGLMVRTLRGLIAVPTGLAAAERVLIADVDLPRARYPDQRILTFVQELTQAAARAPAVRSAALMTSVPLDPRGAAEYGFDVEGLPSPEGQSPKAEILWTTPGYLDTLGIPLLSGRDLRWGDVQTAPHVVLVNEAFVRRYLPQGSPLGRRISHLVGPGEDFWEIAGVIGDVHTKGLDRAPAPMIVLPLLQNPVGRLRVGLRAASGDPAPLFGALRSQVLSLDGELALSRPQLLTQVVSASLSEKRFQMMLLAIFAGIALVLAAIGIYGVVAYGVAQRSREIGIRMALGADSRLVRRMVVGGGLRMAAVGVGLGLAGALALTRALASLLYGVSTTDPLTMGVTGLILLGTAVLASFLPARRATKVDPAVSLRAE
jgi:predicted permease